MERRELIKSLGVLGLGISLPFKVKAFSLEEEDVSESVDPLASFKSEISNNHGHQFGLNANSIVLLLRKSLNQEVVSLSIQGDSGHAHHLELATKDILLLLNIGSIEIVSTEDIHHSHTVKIIYEEKNVEPTPVPDPVPVPVPTPYTYFELIK